MTVRPATPADAPFIVEFNCRLARETESKELDVSVVKAGVSALLDDSTKGRYWIAELNGQPIGQVMVTYEWTDWRNGVFWWLQSVYVRADQRGHGVFSALFREVQRFAAADPQVRGLRLYVHKQNHRAREVYRQLGLNSTGYVVLSTPD
jgi:ribosomal protein S18 acetylase RimI-like enzyme